MISSILAIFSASFLFSIDTESDYTPSDLSAYFKVDMDGEKTFSERASYTYKQDGFNDTLVYEGYSKEIIRRSIDGEPLGGRSYVSTIHRNLELISSSPFENTEQEIVNTYSMVFLVEDEQVKKVADRLSGIFGVEDDYTIYDPYPVIFDMDKIDRREVHEYSYSLDSLTFACRTEEYDFLTLRTPAGKFENVFYSKHHIEVSGTIPGNPNAVIKKSAAYTEEWIAPEVGKIKHAYWEERVIDYGDGNVLTVITKTESVLDSVE